MSQILSDGARTKSVTEIGTQPIALAAGALAAIVFGIALIGVWRSYGTPSPQQERPTAVRQLQDRNPQTSEPGEMTRALQFTQQDTIDQLQIVQDQLQSARRRLAIQQAQTKRLAEQVSSLREAIDGLRQSFASAPASDAAAAQRVKSIETKFPSK